MPELKPFTAANTFRTDDSGYAAFETLGRRVGGQYEQAGNDFRDIGRAKAATINMLGRWPFNILELQKRETERYRTGVRGRSDGAEPGGMSVRAGRSGSSVTDAQFAPRRMPNLAALNEMSEGAGAFGRMVGGSREVGSSTRSDRDGYSRQVLRERDRQARLDNEASQKRWDTYEKDLNKYNDALEETTQKWFNEQTPDGYGNAGDYGGEDTTGQYTNQTTASGRSVTVPVYQPDEQPENDAGGGGFSIFSPSTW